MVLAVRLQLESLGWHGAVYVGSKDGMIVEVRRTLVHQCSMVTGLKVPSPLPSRMLMSLPIEFSGTDETTIRGYRPRSGLRRQECPMRRHNSAMASNFYCHLA